MVPKTRTLYKRFRTHGYSRGARHNTVACSRGHIAIADRIVACDSAIVHTGHKGTWRGMVHASQKKVCGLPTAPARSPVASAEHTHRAHENKQPAHARSLPHHVLHTRAIRSKLRRSARTRVIYMPESHGFAFSGQTPCTRSRKLPWGAQPPPSLAAFSRERSHC